MRFFALAVVCLLASSALADGKPTSAGAGRLGGASASCRSHRDCVFLPSICPDCAPCSPTMRRVGNRKQLRSIKRLQSVASCALKRCFRCSSPKNWIPATLACVKGSCVARRRVPPLLPHSKERICHRDRDCVFRPRPACGCDPCGTRWRPVVNRHTAQRIRKLNAIKRCPRPRCAKCAQPLRWLGSPICRKGQCTVR